MTMLNQKLGNYTGYNIHKYDEFQQTGVAADKLKQTLRPAHQYHQPETLPYIREEYCILPSITYPSRTEKIFGAIKRSATQISQKLSGLKNRVNSAINHALTRGKAAKPVQYNIAYNTANFFSIPNNNMLNSYDILPRNGNSYDILPPK